MERWAMETAPEEPSQTDLMEVIQGSRVALEGKIQTVAIEVTLLHAVLRKVSDKVCIAEGMIADLLSKVATLIQQMTTDNSKTTKLEVRAEDMEWRSRYNNFCLLGFPKYAEGKAIEVIKERWIKDTLHPSRLSSIFAVKRVHRALVPPTRPGAPPRTIKAASSITGTRTTSCRRPEKPILLKDVRHWLEMWDKSPMNKRCMAQSLTRKEGIPHETEGSSYHIERSQNSADSGRIVIQEDGTMAMNATGVVIDSQQDETPDPVGEWPLTDPNG
ncbi:hypothetical protein NDU88_006521 [Pleurodeles waltl]|uniref:Uncharacterized protein n=1 Tax=Pleurodeles waltl TaxID=8319 RepID=A0AAV7SQ60_PLEWA|nr:hypothetical protein NDU88_006521 [Pleurodeles waltl]